MHLWTSFFLQQVVIVDFHAHPNSQASCAFCLMLHQLHLMVCSVVTKTFLSTGWTFALNYVKFVENGASIVRTCSCVFNVLKLLTDYVVALEQFRLQKVSESFGYTPYNKNDPVWSGIGINCTWCFNNFVIQISNGSYWPKIKVVV